MAVGTSGDGLATAPPTSNHLVTGYWLASIPGKGFGIIHGTGPLAGTAHAAFLGSTRGQLSNNLHPAVHQLQLRGVNAVQVFEVADGPVKLIDTALAKGSAWATGPASVRWDAVPTIILGTVLTAALGGALVGAGQLAEGTAAGGVATAGGAAGAAEAGGGGALTGAAAGGAAGAGATGALKTAGKAVTKAAGKVSPGKVAAAAGALTIAGLFTDVSWWKGAGMILAGAILLILAVRELT